MADGEKKWLIDVDWDYLPMNFLRSGVALHLQVV